MVDLGAVVVVLENNALIVGAVLLAAGFFLGLLNRAAAYLVLAAGLFYMGTVLAGRSGDPGGGTAVLVTVGLGLGSAVAVFLAARYLLAALEFLVFLSGWFLILFSAYGLGFTTDYLKVGLWLVAGLGSVFLTHRAAGLLFHTHTSWRRPTAGGHS